MTNRLKLLIAYGGSSCADAAIEGLVPAGLQREVVALVISRADQLLPWGDEPIGSCISEETAAFQKARAGAVQAVEETAIFPVQASERAEAYFPDWKVNAELYANSPALGIIKKVEEWQADLVVVGT